MPLTSRLSRRVPAPRLVWLLGFILFCCVVPAMLMWATGLGSGIHTIVSWLHFEGSSDSWTPINHAFAYVDTHANATGLYEETYYRAENQFIYAPQGLAALQGIRDLLNFNIWAEDQGNIISWPLLPAMVFISALTIWQFIDRDKYAPATLLLIAACATLSVFFFYPLTKAYHLGQIQNWLTAFLALSLICCTADRRFWAGVFIGLTALIKPHVAAVLLWALLRRNWQFAAGLLTPIALASLLSLWRYGFAVHLEYLDLLSFLSSRGESYFASHSFESALYRLLHNGNNLEWDGRHASVTYVPWVHMLASSLSMLTLLLASWPVRGTGRDFRFLDYAIILAALIIASPVAYDHHYGIVAFIAPGAVLIWLGLAPSDRPRWLPLVGGVSYAVVGGMYAVLDRLWDTDFNILQSYRLYGIIPGLICLFILRAKSRVSREETPVSASAAMPVPLAA